MESYTLRKPLNPNPNPKHRRDAAAAALAASPPSLVEMILPPGETGDGRRRVYPKTLNPKIRTLNPKP